MIDIPVIIQSAEDRIAGQVFAQGRHMARQEEWCAIGTLLRGYDAARAQSPAGRPLAEILASGARSDAVEAGIAAANRGDAAAAQCPLDQLRAEVDALCCDHGLALVLARAHAEVGLAWRGPDRHGDHTPEARAAFHAHFAAAQRLVDRFDACEADAPSLAAMRCTLLEAAPRPAARILDDYADLIELDPEMPAYMRALGRNLLPSGFGTYDMLEDGARRIGAETADVWGAGGYAWVYLDALALDRGAFLTLDDEHFVAGLHDILAMRPGQETANLLAAFTGFSLAPAPDAPAAERRVASAFDWIVRDHLREVHATAWAAAPARTGPIAGRACMSGDAADRGAARALSSLGQLFADDLAAGRRVAVDATGWRTA
ncbi:hypothetical protein [Roseivivax jejudonensis]|uniref:hypothetical protein n=1 Tax=Roseivivax jejudonensis TaxID=1529041 RepID=UPI000A2695DE|nr:hypothetical protein [Roseivivax jejudonensis]